MSSRHELEQRKAALLSQIQQQRLDLAGCSKDWHRVTSSYDRGWNALLNLRSWALVGSSIMAIWSVRHPRFAVRWAKRGFGIWSAWRLAKKTLQKQRLRG
ncbi:membrane protein [Pluralibacter gergoviae]|uniref:YqjK-like family protein n=1 Tax=Pluralibacter gergoviae TaxID=61647 RepID=UPI0006505DF2|nr:YqjK-like family protein [Pluralibacter gergoviae]KMK27477.1 membrane protein [Pluralibacter gergoviae]